MKKLFAATLSALMLTASLTAPALAVQPKFADVPQQHWACECVTEMAELGILQGTGGGNFNPSGTLTAAEFLAMVVRAFYSEELSDFPSGGDWYAPYHSVAYFYRLLEGTDITYESLTAPLNRYEMALLVKNVCFRQGVLATAACANEIADYKAIPTEELQNAILYCYATGVLQGDANGNFNGTAVLTRAEGAVILSRIIHAERIPDKILWGI